jgi:hypothetical protein
MAPTLVFTEFSGIGLFPWQATAILGPVEGIVPVPGKEPMKVHRQKSRGPAKILARLIRPG